MEELGISKQLYENSKKSMKEEIDEELKNQREIMLSQLHPHFLFNALTAISALCDVDTEQAQKAIVYFSNYLRGNLESIKSIKLMSFRGEMAYVQNYLELEKIRFSNKISVLYDIRVDDFMIPSLTFQPLVEKAIRYGVTKRDGDGLLKISVQHVEDDIVIQIIDNGDVYNVEDMLNPSVKRDMIIKDSKALELHNISERLMDQIGGKLFLISSEETGNIAKIVMPYIHDNAYIAR